MNSGKRPYLLVFLAIAILFSGCGKNELKRVIEDHFNALNRHDIKALVAGYDPKVEVTSSGWEGIHNGTAEVSAAYSKYFHSSPDLKYDVGNVYFSGDSIITVEYTASGTMKNPEGLPAYMLGKRYILNY